MLKDDIEEGDLNRPEMTAKLVCTLETAMYRAMQEKQYSAVASNAKVLMSGWFRRQIKKNNYYFFNSAKIPCRIKETRAKAP